MAIAASLQRCLIRNGIRYDVVSHTPTSNSMETAQAAHVPGDRLAKSVVLRDEDGYLMAVLPATHRLELGRLYHQLKRPLGLATERELAPLFKDCEAGAIPPVGSAYGMAVIVDDSLMEQPEVYFEGGDHCEVVKVDSKDFYRLVGGAAHGRFSHHI